MKHFAAITSLAVSASLASITPLTAAQPAPGGARPVDVQAATPKPAEKCLANVRSLNGAMSKQGYWLGESDYGYGYPMGGYGYGFGMPMDGRLGENVGGYASARPGYEIRTLLASATIFARMGQEQSCQTVLATTRVIYQRYMANLHSSGAASVDQAGWQQRQIAAAQPVTAKDVAFRSDQLIDTDVLSPANETLGTVHDLVTSPQTGKIAYVIIARGGLFGIDASYVPVPWDDFKATPNASLLVLDTNKVAMSAAPQVGNDQLTKPGQFESESKKIDAYWTSRIKPTLAAN